MDKIYLIYEWYNHFYYGFADYRGEFIHFAFKKFLDKSYPFTYLFEIIPATKELFDYTVSYITSDDDSIEDELLPLWDYMDENKDKVTMKKATVHIDSAERNDPPYKNSFIDWLD